MGMLSLLLSIFTFTSIKLKRLNFTFRTLNKVSQIYNIFFSLSLQCYVKATISILVYEFFTD